GIIRVNLKVKVVKVKVVKVTVAVTIKPKPKVGVLVNVVPSEAFVGCEEGEQPIAQEANGSSSMVLLPISTRRRVLYRIIRVNLKVKVVKVKVVKVTVAVTIKPKPKVGVLVNVVPSEAFVGCEEGEQPIAQEANGSSSMVLLPISTRRRVLYRVPL
nr:hypothetical protein [Tanacetum cinerariifolium]